MEFSVSTLWNSPTDIEEWDLLAIRSANFFQSNEFNNVQNYNEKPVYFELRRNGKLVAGVRLFYWESRKFKTLTNYISKSLLQQGEIIYDDREVNETELLICIERIKEEVRKFISQNQIVKITVAGIYGREELLLNFDFPAISAFHFNAGYVDLKNKTDEQIIENFNRNTKRNLKKANESGLEFSELSDPKIFNDVLADIFSQQIPRKPAPNRNFVHNFFEKIKHPKTVAIHQVKQKNEILAVSLFVKCGESAYSLFGGSLKNEIGAGHFLYYNLMKLFKNEGINKFYFGQVSREEDLNNLKFSKGITVFKRGFGLTEIPSFKKIYITNKFKYKTWQWMLKIQELRNRR